jgi:hypothetical protein
MPLEFFDFLVFALMALAGYSIFVLLREVLARFIKLEAVAALNKWGGFGLGIGRAFLLSGLVIFLLTISTMTYFKDSVNNSFLGKKLVLVTPTVYSKMWNGVISKFMTGEKFNNTILEAQQ